MEPVIAKTNITNTTTMHRELARKIVSNIFVICILAFFPFLVSFIVKWSQRDNYAKIYNNNYSPSVGGGRVSTTMPMTVQSYVKYSNNCGDKYQFITTYSVFEGYNESCIVNRDTCYDLQYLYQNHPIGGTMDISFDPNCNEACDTQYYTEQKANNSYPAMKSSNVNMWACLGGFIFTVVFGIILIVYGDEVVYCLTTSQTTVLPRRRSRQEVVTTPNPSNETVIQKDVNLAPTDV